MKRWYKFFVAVLAPVLVVSLVWAAGGMYVDGRFTTKDNESHYFGGPDSENASILNIGGEFRGGTTDVRAVNINSKLYMRPLYSSEGINNRPRFVLPDNGVAASLEGFHVDLSNIDWSPAGSVGGVYGVRVRGVPLNNKASEAAGVLIEAGWATNVDTAYNIWSQGATARNRIDGNLEVYGTLRYDMVEAPPQGAVLRGYIKIKVQGITSYMPYYN